MTTEYENLKRCRQYHTEWIIEYDNGIWMCEMCRAKRAIIGVAKGLLLLGMAKAMAIKEDPIGMAGGIKPYVESLKKRNKEAL